MRWDRLHLFHLTLLMFLNCYGYDFQQTNDPRIKELIKTPQDIRLFKKSF
jgi:hypothetical protein